MNNAWQRYLEAASGVTGITRKRAEQLVKALVKQGELAAERAEKAADELLKRSEQNRKAMAAVARSESEKAVGRLGLARQRDIERLERRLDKLERASGGAKKTTKRAKKASKSAAQRSAKKTAAAATAKAAKKSAPGS